MAEKAGTWIPLLYSSIPCPWMPFHFSLPNTFTEPHQRSFNYIWFIFVSPLEQTFSFRNFHHWLSSFLFNVPCSSPHSHQTLNLQFQPSPEAQAPISLQNAVKLLICSLHSQNHSVFLWQINKTISINLAISLGKLKLCLRTFHNALFYIYLKTWL